jgi:hypothetical protein
VFGSKALGALLALLIGVLAPMVHAGEASLEDEPPPESVEGLRGPLAAAFRKRIRQKTLFPQLAALLEDAPPFFRDTELRLDLRSYYYRLRLTTNQRSEAWALGGGLVYRSGRWKEFFSLGAALYTSQRLVGKQAEGGTLLLERTQDGYTVLGQAYARLHWRAHRLTLYRQELTLPYVNKRDNRMTPNTFEGYVAEGSEGPIDYAAGHVLQIKRRNADHFISMSEAAGVDPGPHEGLSLLGLRWNVSEHFSVGAIDYWVKDVLNILYAEADGYLPLGEDLSLRAQAQFTHQASVGNDRLTGHAYETWVVGGRLATSYKSALLSVAFSKTDEEERILSPFGSYPGYLSLMQLDFNRAGEEAYGAAASYHFGRIGIPQLSLHVGMAWGRDAVDSASKALPDRREFNVTLDYRFESGLLRGLWLRARASNVHVDGEPRDSNNIRVILNYDIPVL